MSARGAAPASALAARARPRLEEVLAAGLARLALVPTDANRRLRDEEWTADELEAFLDAELGAYAPAPTPPHDDRFPLQQLRMEVEVQLLEDEMGILVPDKSPSGPMYITSAMPSDPPYPKDSSANTPAGALRRLTNSELTYVYWNVMHPHRADRAEMARILQTTPEWVSLQIRLMREELRQMDLPVPTE